MNKIGIKELRIMINNILKENVQFLDKFSDKIIQENDFDIQDQMTSIDGKYATKKSIINAVYNILKDAKVEGIYKDEYWMGIKKLTNTLSKAGIEFSLQKSNYAGHLSIGSDSPLPTRKEYKYFLKVKDKSGKEVNLPLKVTCAFVGKTGTMEDDIYELTYVIEA